MILIHEKYNLSLKQIFLYMFGCNISCISHLGKFWIDLNLIDTKTMKKRFEKIHEIKYPKNHQSNGFDSIFLT